MSDITRNNKKCCNDKEEDKIPPLQPLPDWNDFIAGSYQMNRERQPFYDNSADYNTNSKSYYDDLARKTRLISILGHRIWEYDEQMVKRLEEWDARLDHFPEDVKNLLIKWMEDGTLDEIINENIFGELDASVDELLGTFYYDEIITTEVLDNKNKYIINKVPPKDKFNCKITPTKEYDYDFKTVRQFAENSASSLSINASIYDTKTFQPLGVHVKDGKVIKNEAGNVKTWTLAYDKETQLFNAFPPTKTGEEIVNSGYTDTWHGFYPIIMDGKVLNSSIWESRGNTTEKHNRQVLAQQEDKTILIFTFRGREDDYEGYTYDDIIKTIVPYGVKFAYVFDGGGSTQTVKDNLLLNPPLDGGYKTERPVFDAMSFIKPTKKKREDIYKILGDLSAVLQKLEARHISKYGDKIPGKLWHDDSLYIKQENGLYSYTGEIGANSEVQRMIGTYQVGKYKRLYLGTVNNPLSIQSSHNIIVSLGSDNDAYRVQLEHIKGWEKPDLLNGWQEHERTLMYKNVNNYETRISGAVICGTQNLSGKPIFKLPVEYAPSQPILVPCSTLSAARQSNDIVIYPNGNVTLRYPPLEPNNLTAIQIEHTFYRGVQS